MPNKITRVQTTLYDINVHFRIPSIPCKMKYYLPGRGLESKCLNLFLLAWMTITFNKLTTLSVIILQ